jgi:hypothetical protein
VHDLEARIFPCRYRDDDLLWWSREFIPASQEDALVRSSCLNDLSIMKYNVLKLS